MEFEKELENAPLVDFVDGLYVNQIKKLKRVIVVLGVLLVALLAQAIFVTTFFTVGNHPPEVLPFPDPSPCEPPGTDQENSNNDFPFQEVQQWDISSNHSRSLQFTTDEGTWLNLDVSPDGQEILFDLLGDIYVMPITGGSATLLRGGVSFDTQPRYSPDGGSISFTSDESGSDNVWVMNRAAGEAWQVTDEKFHFVNNAVWAQSGTEIVAVKWYTSTRSLGAGELWKYSINNDDNSAHEGERVVGRVSASSQIGPEEPFWAHNDTALYYSQNTADYTTFQYSKDPHKGIYSIKKYILASKEIEAVTGGYGGAARPVVSHSGLYLAFIKRIEYHTSLLIRNLDTGNELILIDSLSFDQQACYAPSGVYPSFAWTPEDDAIIIWAAGKFWKVSMTGVSTPIPFTVDVSLSLGSTVRSQHDPSTGEIFDVKVVTWPTVSNTNDKVAFTALASTYLKVLPDGVPQRLSQGNSTAFEYSPTFSPDGKWVVHILWTDSELGTVQLVNLETRHTVDVATHGRYTQPRFSPLGNAIVYVKLSGDSLSGYQYSTNSGIHTVAVQLTDETATVGKTTFITASGRNPVFLADGASLLVTRGDYPHVSLEQISAVDGTLQRVFAETKYGTAIEMSPNMKYIAFVEFKHVFVAPFIPSDSPMQLTARPALATPGVQRCSLDAGNFLSWSPDSTTLRWSLGSDIFEVNPMAIQDCKDAACTRSHVQQISLGFSQHTSIGQHTLVFDNVTIVTMEGDEIIENGRLVVVSDIISALGPRDSIVIPSGATVIDVEGGYAFPGFIDAHAHWTVGSENQNFAVQQSWEFLINLAFGVTTVHNPSADTVAVFSDAELVRAGKKLGPRIFSTGTILYGAGGSIHAEIDSLEDAVSALKNLRSYGAWSAKSYNQPRRSTRQQILEAARQLNMNIVPEGGMAFYWNLNQIIDGHTTIEHSLPMAPLYKDVITLFASSGTAYTPTLIVNYGGLWGEIYWYQHTNVWEDERMMTFAPQETIRAMSMRRLKASDPDYHHFETSKSVAAIARAGGTVSTGAHGQLQGIGIHWEIRMFAQGNISNHDAMRAATINPAKALGLDQYIGSLKAGKLADIIFYGADCDPLENIEEAAQVKWVLKDGRLYDAATMDQLQPSFAKLPPGPVLNTPHV